MLIAQRGSFSRRSAGPSSDPLSGEETQEKMMMRLIAAAGFVVAVATSAVAITPAPVAQPGEMITEVAYGCGPFRTRVRGVCVARTTIRRTRRVVRRGYRRGYWRAGYFRRY